MTGDNGMSRHQRDAQTPTGRAETNGMSKQQQDARTPMGDVALQSSCVATARVAAGGSAPGQNARMGFRIPLRRCRPLGRGVLPRLKVARASLMSIREYLASS